MSLRDSVYGIMICDVPTHYGECMIITMNRGLFTSVSTVVSSYDRWEKDKYYDAFVPFFLTLLSVYLRVRYLFKTFGTAGEVSVKRSKRSNEPVVYEVD